MFDFFLNGQMSDTEMQRKHRESTNATKPVGIAEVRLAASSSTFSGARLTWVTIADGADPATALLQWKNDIRRFPLSRPLVKRTSIPQLQRLPRHDRSLVQH